MTQPLRIIFAGTPDFAARHLQALIDSEHEVVGVYSQPDRPAGRGKKLKASEVKELALAHDLPRPAGRSGWLYTPTMSCSESISACNGAQRNPAYQQK